jgi:DNA-binding transcriptional LysR family regulator
MLTVAHRYLLSVAQTGSIRASSQALNVAASAISRQIQLVEHQFGYKLFERFPSGMVLTHEGQILVHHLSRTVRELELAQAEMNALHDLVTGTIHFSAIEGVLSSWLLPAMGKFRETYPGINFNGRILGSQAAYELVMSDRLDFGVVVYDSEWHGVDIHRHIDTPLVVAMPPSHPFCAQQAVSLKDLSSEPLTMLDRNFTTRDVFDKIVTISGMSMNVAFEVNHIEIAKRYVMATGGVTILPEYAVTTEVAHGQLVMRPLAHARAVLDTVLFTRKSATQSKSTQRFIEELLSVTEIFASTQDGRK